MNELLIQKKKEFAIEMEEEKSDKKERISLPFKNEVQ